MSSYQHLPVTIRQARLDDAEGISLIHRSHTPRWYRQIGNEQCEVGYGDLTLDERLGFGGPWMSTETCAIHLNNLLLRHHMPLAAELGGLPVAEMELFAGREGRPYGMNCHIGLLYVHRDFIGRGIGTAMVAKAVQFAKSSRCDTLTVTAMPADEAFYRKQGFSCGEVQIEIEAVADGYPVDRSPLPPPANVQSFAWGMDMPIGRLQSSAYHVFEMADAYALPSWAETVRFSAFMTIGGRQAIVSGASRRPGNATVLGWSAGGSAGDLALAALNLAKSQGFSSANMLLCQKDYEDIESRISSRLIGRRTTLIRKL